MTPPDSSLGSTTTGSGRALQARMELFARVVVIVILLTMVLQFVVNLASGHVNRPDTPMYGAAAIGTAVLAAFWAACRFGTWKTRTLYGIEAVGLVAAITAFALSGRYLNETVGSNFSGGIRWRDTPAAPLVSELLQQYTSMAVAMALTQVMILRSALVPSSAQRSLLLTAAVGLPVVVVNGFGWAPVDADVSLRELARNSEAVEIAMALAMWWALSTIVCVVTSRVIFSLRAEVRTARKLGQYTLEEKLGEGGMGEVYRASHAMMRRPTAIKLLPAQHAEPTALARFEREVQLTAQLSHPNTITVFDYGRTPDGVLYYAMELLDGATLNEIVKAFGPMPPERVIHVLKMVAGSLNEAHQLDLVHRDIKPSNIMLCERGGESDVAKVLDFGLAKPVRIESASARLHGIEDIAGTPLYMSPESISSPEMVDARSDLYSLGAVGYYVLTGKHVFNGQSVVEVCGHHLHSSPVPPSERLGLSVPRDLEELLLRCLEKDSARRPQSAAELRAALDGCDHAFDWTPSRAREWWREAGRKLLSSKVSATNGTATLVAQLRPGAALASPT